MSMPSTGSRRCQCSQQVACVARLFNCLLVGALALVTSDLASGQAPASAIDSSISRSVHWLAHAVPAWLQEHRCASCHHQGDAACALIVAAQFKQLPQTTAVLSSSLQWCQRPTEWRSNRGDANASDYRLAEIQFAHTLRVARLLGGSHGEVSRQAARTDDGTSSMDATHGWQIPIDAAAGLLASWQSADGAWRIEDDAPVASPITHGPLLLTANAASVLAISTHAGHGPAVERAWRFLASFEARNVFEASSQIVALRLLNAQRQPARPAWPDDAGRARQSARAILLAVPLSDSQGLGYGPYLSAPSENFDTALALLALCADDHDLHAERLVASQKFLLDRQRADGSWEETTRSDSVSSYAHRVSTTAWCLQALLASRNGSTLP